MRKYQFRDDFTWQTGKHALKVGANYIHTKLGGYFYFGASGYTVAWFDDPVEIATNSRRLPAGLRDAGRGAQRSSSRTARRATTRTSTSSRSTPRTTGRSRRKLTLNLGLRWDANIGNLPDQTNNRTMQILQQLNDPRAQAHHAATPEKLARTTPSWTEFQPRFGFAYDVSRERPHRDPRRLRHLLRPALPEPDAVLAVAERARRSSRRSLNLTNTAVGRGPARELPLRRRPAAAAAAARTTRNLPSGAFGRINDPDAKEPYVQKFSIGFQKALGTQLVAVERLRAHARDSTSRATRSSTRGSTASATRPTRARRRPRRAACAAINSRYFDSAFVAAGLPANRLEQINMITTTNRSFFDSWTTTLQGPLRHAARSRSATCWPARDSWGGQPTASYSGNGIAIDPENQFKEEEFGPTRLDERHRIVASGVFDLPMGFQVAPVFQYATARPYSLNTGFDIDGDGLDDRRPALRGRRPGAVFAVRGNAGADPGAQPARAASRPASTSSAAASS